MKPIRKHRYLQIALLLTIGVYLLLGLFSMTLVKDFSFRRLNGGNYLQLETEKFSPASHTAAITTADISSHQLADGLYKRRSVLRGLVFTNITRLGQNYSREEFDVRITISVVSCFKFRAINRNSNLRLKGGTRLEFLCILF